MQNYHKIFGYIVISLYLCTKVHNENKSTKLKLTYKKL